MYVEEPEGEIFAHQARMDFRQARQRAFFQGVLALITRQPQDLLPFEEVRQRLRLRSRSYKGLHNIPLDKIVGSVGRYHDFTRTFLPRQNFTAHRWQRIDQIQLMGQGLPPVEVYKVGDVYFVRDGNHRVSVARQNGAKTIEAYVWEYPTKVPLTPDVDLDELLIKQEYVEFLEHTRLDKLRPEQKIEFTIPGGYYKLEEHIAGHRYFMGLEQRREIRWDEAVVSWYDNIYRPMVEFIRKYKVLEGFPGRTEADLYIWIMDHLYFLRERYGDEVHFEDAATDFARRFGQRRLARLWQKVKDFLHSVQD
ncbi:MAG: hypothetical protein ACUVV0_03020 [Anaerolineae bacterium]